MRILAFTKYSQLAASSRLRVFQYLDEFRERGYHVTVAPLLSDEYVQRLYTGQSLQWSKLLLGYVERVRKLAAAHSGFDLIWLEKELLPWFPAFLERLVAHWRIPYVVDYDDAIFHNYDNHRLAAVRYLLGQKIDCVMSHADCVVVGNEYLASRARRAGAKQIKYLPTAVDLTRYPAAPLPADTPFTIGWIGTPITAKYLQLIAPALRRVCEQIPAQVMTVGAGEINLGIPVRALPWHEDTEAESISKFHVGVMPLSDGPFERGKCGYKLIQCMAVGRPVIGSPVGVNSHIIRNGINGFLANSVQDWTDALLRLYRDSNLRETMAIEARITVAAQYCTQVTAPQLASIFEDVLDNKRYRAHPQRSIETAPLH